MSLMSSASATCFLMQPPAGLPAALPAAEGLLARMASSRRAAAPRVVALVLLRRPVLSTRVAGVEPYALRLYVDMPLMLTNCSVG